MNSETINLDKFLNAGITIESITRTLQGMPNVTITGTEITCDADMVYDIEDRLFYLLQDAYETRQRRIENPQHS